MIIKKDGCIERNSTFPDTDWYNEQNLVIDETTPEGKAMADRVIAEWPDVEIISKNGIVIDVISKPNIEKIFSEKLTAIRHQRDRLLAECDFTQLPDAPISSELKTAYTVYRQALRDLPETVTADNIDSVQFPVKPE